jgi:ABC-type cobalamin/fe3+-siderophore transport system, ATPase component
MIRLENIAWEVGGRRIVEDIDVGFAADTVTALVGPNGSGKTTVMHLAAGLRKPSAGRVLLDGEPLAALPPRERARRIALVEQHPSTDLDLTVREVVALGRIPHVGSWPGARDRDRSAVDEAMEVAAVTHLASRRWPTLSGGERQRVHLARSLAQRPRILLLDEPTNHLDLSHQLDFLERVSGLDLTVVAVLHDLDLAAAFCRDMAVMHRGHLHAHGAMAEVLTAEMIDEVFEVTARVEVDDRRRVNWSRR